jgi:hypothetical protein
MRRNLLGKTLALGVVVLFIGLVLHPAFAFEHKLSVINVDNKDDCIECQSNRMAHLAGKILNSLEKNEVLSKIIDSNNPDDDRPICETLLNLIDHFNNLAYYYGSLAYAYPEDSFSFKFYMLLGESIFQLVIYSYALGLIVDCWDFYPY